MIGARSVLKLQDRGQTLMSSPQPPAAKLWGRRPEIREIPLQRIVLDPDHPRRHFDSESLERLAESIARKGMLAPVRVRKDEENGCWIVVCGQRRCQAARTAGLGSVPCIVVEGEPTESDSLEEQLIENLHREDLTPIEQANAFRSLMTLRDWNATELAGELHIHKGTVTRMLSLLGLPETIRKHVANGRISATAAYEISKLPSRPARIQLAKRVLLEKLTRSETAEAAWEMSESDKSSRRRRSTKTFVFQSGAKVVVFGNERMGTEETLVALEEAIARVRGELDAEHGYFPGKGPCSSGSCHFAAAVITSEELAPFSSVVGWSGTGSEPGQNPSSEDIERWFLEVSTDTVDQGTLGESPAAS